MHNERDDDPTKLANGPEQTPNHEGLARGGASEGDATADTPGAAASADETDESTRVANGPEQTPGHDGLAGDGA